MSIKEIEYKDKLSKNYLNKDNEISRLDIKTIDTIKDDGSEENNKMQVIDTKYGRLYEVSVAETYDTGEIESCRLDEESELKLLGTSIVPLYGYPDVRRKESPAVKFYKSGNIKTISLNESTIIETQIGKVEAEKLMLYEEGFLKRLFPLDGKLSGYWSEDDEYNLAKKYEFDFSFATFKAKVISLQFYKGGQLKSLTLWPREFVQVKLEGKNSKARIGISLYENGKLKSFEPYNETIINTPIGDIEAYDKNAIGIHGEENSLNFYEDGKVKSLITSTNIIEVENVNGDKIIHSPKEVMIYSNSDVKDLITVSIEFYGEKIIIDNKYEYDLERNKFIIKRYKEKVFTLMGDRK